MADPFSTLPPEVALEQAQISRQQQLANLLMQQGMQQPQGQMVSGRYVKPSIFQNLAGLANIYVGQKKLEESDKQRAELAQKLREGETKSVQEYFKALQGTPETRTEMAGPYTGDIPAPVLTQPATGPNYQQALQVATNPYAPSWLKAQAVDQMKMQKLAPEEVLLRPDPVTGELKPVASGGEKLTENQRNYRQAQKEGYQGTFFDYQRDLKRAGATSINLPSEGERKAGTMANILDKNILQMQTALGIDPSAVKPNVPASVVEAITGPNVVSRAMKPAQRQVVEDSQLDVLDAALTLRTGAAYTREQLLGMRDTYFPKLGDKPETIAAKKQRLETLLDSAYIAAGRATPPRVSEPYQAPAQKPIGQQLNIPTIGKAKPPAGIDPAVWNVMTPQEKALWK